MQLVLVIMSLTVIWNVYGLATGFFDRTWKKASVPVTFIAYLVNASWIAFLGFARLDDTTSFIVGAMLGAIMFAWSTAGVVIQLIKKIDVRFISWLPGYAGAGIAAISGVIVMILCLQAALSR